VTAEALVSRLHNVKFISEDKFVAGCPLCQSRQGRPISVRSMADGRTLLHAFCGCGTFDVLKALGLSTAVLFPEGSRGQFKPERRPFDGVQVLHNMAHELVVVALIANDLLSGKADDEQFDRLTLAARRFNEALSLVGEGPVPEAIKRIRRACSGINSGTKVSA
jgi:hypothetical protein